MSDTLFRSYSEENHKHTGELHKVESFNGYAQIAAEIGKQLLEENQEAAERIRILEENEKHRQKEFEELKEEVSSLRSSRTRLQQQLGDAEHMNQSLQKEIEQAREHYKLMTSNDKSYSILAENYKIALKELESTKHELESMKQKESQLKKEMTRVRRESKKLLEVSFKEENGTPPPAEAPSGKQSSDPPGNRPRKGSNNAELIQLGAQLADLQVQFDAKIEHAEELERQNKKLNEMVKTLTKNNVELTNEKEDRDRLLKKLREEQQERFLAMEEANEQRITRKRSSSIASEIEKNARKEPPKVAEVPLEPPVDDSAARANEEYFHMTCAAMKVKFAIKNKINLPDERAAEKVFMIRSTDLYEQVLRDKVPFHEWHAWLKNQLITRVTQMVNEEREMEEKQKRMEQQSQQGPVWVTLENSGKDAKNANANTKPKPCTNFQPQFWKKGLCKNCTFKKEEHTSVK